MRVEPFRMERWQSLHEHRVEINLADSGVHPLSIREVLGDRAEHDEILDQRLVYTQTNGTPELRRRVASLYPGASQDEVEIVSGGSEANHLVTWGLVEPGDEVVVMLPNYMQVWGLVRSQGAVVRAWHLEPDLEGGCWRAPLERLESLVGEHTRLVAICNPNNPTGHRLGHDELDEICRIAERHGAWVLSDEVYQGSELDGERTPTAWGRYERVVVTNSLSKSYGLPGLRLGWIVAPRERCARFWALHDYTTIAPGALSDLIATRVLEPERRARLLERTQDILRRNHALVAAWLERNGIGLRHIPPAAGAILYLRYAHEINSTELASRLLDEKSVLVVPGDHFGMDGWMRIGYGGETRDVQRGLERVREVLATLE